MPFSSAPLKTPLPHTQLTPQTDQFILLLTPPLSPLPQIPGLRLHLLVVRDPKVHRDFDHVCPCNFDTGGRGLASLRLPRRVNRNDAALRQLSPILEPQ